MNLLVYDMRTYNVIKVTQMNWQSNGTAGGSSIYYITNCMQVDVGRNVDPATSDELGPPVYVHFQRDAKFCFARWTNHLEVLKDGVAPLFMVCGDDKHMPLEPRQVRTRQAWRD